MKKNFHYIRKAIEVSFITLASIFILVLGIINFVSYCTPKGQKGMKNATNANKIRKGMTKEEMLKIMGNAGISSYCCEANVGQKLMLYSYEPPF